MDFECPVHCKIETSRVFVIAALPDVTAGCHSSCHVQEDGTARTVKELLQEHLQVRLRVWKVSWTYTTANAKKPRSPTVPFLSLFFLFWGVLAGRIQKNMEWLIYGNAYWTPQVAMPWPMTSPWSSGKMHLRGWANVAIHCFKLQLKMKRIYSSFTAQILGANQEYQTKKHRINWSYEKSIKKYIYSVSNSTCLGLNLLLKP